MRHTIHVRIPGAHDFEERPDDPDEGPVAPDASLMRPRVAGATPHETPLLRRAPSWERSSAGDWTDITGGGALMLTAALLHSRGVPS